MSVKFSKSVFNVPSLTLVALTYHRVRFVRVKFSESVLNMHSMTLVAPAADLSDSLLGF